MLKYITIISGVIYLIFSIVILFKKSPLQKQNRLLGFAFLLMSFYSVYVAVLYDALITQDVDILKNYLPVEYVWGALMGPVFYFYILRLLQLESKCGYLKMFIHLLPVFPSVVYLGYFSFLSADDKVILLNQNFKDGIWPIMVLDIIFYIQMTSYLILSYNHISRQIKLSPILKIDDQFYNISWLKLFIVIDLTIMICTFPVLIAFPNETNTSVLAQIIMDVQLVYIFVRTFWENGLFSNMPIEGAEIVEDKSSISTLRISDEISQEYVLMIKVYMENEKPFLKEDCTMQLVSEGVGIPMHQLSYVLNKCCKKNFSDFVNEYRIDLSRHLLQSISYERMTIEAIGFECGFGSISNFNKAFKKITNMTPSEYRNRMQNA